MQDSPDEDDHYLRSPDFETLIQRLMREWSLTFNQAVSAAIRAGLAAAPESAFHQRCRRTLKSGQARTG
jgi:hypothetical protein